LCIYCCCCVNIGIGPWVDVEHVDRNTIIGKLKRNGKLFNTGTDITKTTQSLAYTVGSDWTCGEWCWNRVIPCTACVLTCPPLACYKCDCCRESKYPLPIYNEEKVEVAQVHQYLPCITKWCLCCGKSHYLVRFPEKTTPEDKALLISAALYTNSVYFSNGPLDKKNTILDKFEKMNKMMEPNNPQNNEA